MNKPLKIRLITTLSATLEFYDFTLLIFLAPVMAQVFFPQSDGEAAKLMPVLMLFFAGYLARFVGGMIYSHFGDTRGRKNAYLLSIIMMSLATLGIAVLPGTATIGVAAPILLLLLRTLQGLSLGGEIPGAVIFAAEHSPTKSRGMVTGLVIGGVTFGNVLASGVVSLLYSEFGRETVYDWAWRIPFVLGAGLGLLSLWLRMTLGETPVYQAMMTPNAPSTPFSELIKHHRKPLFRGVLVAAVPAVCISTLFFMPVYQIRYLMLPEQQVFSTSFVVFLLMTLLTLVVAFVSDRTGRLLPLRTGSVVVLVLLPFCIFLVTQQTVSVLLGLLPLLIGNAMIMGIYEAAMIELFPTPVRFSGVAFCHNLAFALLGGASPMLLEYLCSNGWLLAPGLWPAVLAFMLLLVSWRWRDRFREDLIEV